MGGCFSVSLPCDQAVNQVSHWLCVKESYIYDIEKNLTALEATMEALKARRDDLSRRVEREEDRGLRTLAQIQVWLSRVETIENQVNDLISVRRNELQRMCLCGLCSKNLKLSYRYGKKVFIKLEEIENLKSSGLFETVAEKAQASEVVERPIQPIIIGQKLLLERTWNSLIDDKVGLMGLHGMGGVGKTTLLEQINNKLKGSAFDVVIWVVVSKDLQIQKIQEKVAKKLGFDMEDWNSKDEEQKKEDIHSVLRGKKFVLLLDDIWAKVDLKQIGVPFPNRENGSKVVFTTRSKELCGRMGVDDPMEVQCLSPEVALEFFRKKVGEKTLGSHPDIPELAKVVAKKCYGLPLALNVIGETMSFKRTIEEWHRAIHILTSNATAFSGIKDEILPILKYSYDGLKGEQAKTCLQYCALFPEDQRIRKDDLIEYWICEGIIDDNEGIRNAMEQGYEIICNLVRSSLLMEEIEDDVVYMHDVVREMALWITSDYGEQKDNFVVHAGGGLCEMPTFKNWNVVKRLSLMANKIDHISDTVECLQLKTLFLQRNEISLANISGEFFKSMLNLLVLDLSDNEALSELPDGISELVSLKYLNISSTSIECLPIGLQKLKNLIHLDLEYTNLSSVVGISALLNLKVLKLYGSRVAYSSKAKEELKVLEHLEILTICINSDSGLDEFINSQNLMCCTENLEIGGCRLESSDIWRLARMEKLRELFLIECTISEIKMETASITRDIVSPMQNVKNAFFLSLSTIYLSACKLYPKELTWLMFAPNLTKLLISSSNEVEEIINKEKACAGEASGIVPFQKLKYLYLENLPELKNIYWRPLPFSCLKKLQALYCPKLKILPLNTKSGEKGFVIRYKGKEWIEEVEWEDKATKARFLPSAQEIE